MSGRPRRASAIDSCLLAPPTEMQAANKAALDDVRCVLALSTEYFTLEPFVPDIEYEYRIQKVVFVFEAKKKNAGSA